MRIDLLAQFIQTLDLTSNFIQALQADWPIKSILTLFSVYRPTGTFYTDPTVSFSQFIQSLQIDNLCINSLYFFIYSTVCRCRFTGRVYKLLSCTIGITYKDCLSTYRHGSLVCRNACVPAVAI